MYVFYLSACTSEMSAKKQHIKQDDKEPCISNPLKSTNQRERQAKRRRNAEGETSLSNELLYHLQHMFVNVSYIFTLKPTHAKVEWGRSDDVKRKQQMLSQEWSAVFINYSYAHIQMISETDVKERQLTGKAAVEIYFSPLCARMK